MPQITYTPTIGKYLRENYLNKTIAELAAEIGCGKSSVQRWSKQLGLSGKKAGNPHRKPLSAAPPVIRQRPEYSNITREQRIEELLNMAI